MTYIINNTLFEPAHEIMVFFVLLNLILQTCMCSYPVTLTKDNTTSNNTSNSSKPGATQFSIGSFELVY